jgi:hypothetical protein
MRASARPHWRTLLLALLLVAAGCTTGPAPQPRRPLAPAGRLPSRPPRCAGRSGSS